MFLNHIRQSSQPKRALPPRQVFTEFRYIASLFLLTRLALILIGLMAHSLTETGYGKQFSWSSFKWLDIWGVWDSFWYMDIVQNGYSAAGAIPDSPDQTNFPFFPLYPMLMKGLGTLLGGNYYIAGLIVSNLCLLGACYLLYKLVEGNSDRKTARLSVKFLFLYPVSFIFSGLFTESLYLFLCLLCFYLAKRRHWLAVGLAGALLSATRTLGVLIVLPLAWEYLRSIDFKFNRIRLDVLWLALVPVGMICFGLFSYQQTGDFFYFKTNQAAWDRQILNPLVVLWKALKQGLAQGKARILLELSFSVTALALSTLHYKKIGFAYWLLCMYSLLIPLSAGIDSMARYTLPIFPLFIILAKLSRDNDSWNDALTLFLGFVQGCLMVYWCTGQALVV